jgi:FtsP/CotA-like multicopper oxidase with cupredoxin domain
VIKEDGLPALPQNSGWKDTTLVTRETEILVRFDQPASPQKPFMLHCHILEHEDAGMMAQFAVI